ncbi:glutamate/gamma-aminobutyrate family transporter YjeM [Lactococcus hodotermopsidis]|uniref:Glutamate/gamma-aminobutyrate family transporter YjeM n=1 Tax=Pseudolactococcus hodotermopsidis TaxID=2709157 RepID=A0A6A0BAR2_9LACT|nr:amino acid permease [Lactococcus hodotermopsidis]GFH41735.1 glutamate/gamma-aminobutyrate family transporter YjeM [Lactococcus hodotermopsidis]
MKKEIFTFKRLVLVIATTVFSFSSSTTAFFTMGLKSLIWLAVAAVFYFLPFAIINSEFTSAYPKSQSSLYDWLADNLSAKIAFITTFIWYASYFVWMTSLFLKLWIPFGLLIFGKDISQMTTIFGVSAKMVLTILTIFGIVMLTTIINRGFLKIAKLMYVSSILMIGLLILTVGTNLILSLSHPDMILPNLKKAATSKTFFETTNLTGFISQLPFLIFAITAFGGLDTVSSLVEKVGNQHNKFSKALLAGGGIVLIFYFLAIVSWSMGTTVTTNTQTHLGNLMYALMSQLARNIAPNSPLISELYVRYTALVMFTAYLALLATIGYAPLKVLLHAGNRQIFPDKLLKTNENGIHFKAVRAQAMIIGAFVLLVSVGTPLVTTLYNQLTLMTNLARSLPYLLVATAYPFFKEKFTSDYLKLVKHSAVARVLASSVVMTVLLAIGFEIYTTIVSNGVIATLFLIIGPLIFAILANYLYERKANEINPLRRSRQSNS